MRKAAGFTVLTVFTLIFGWALTGNAAMNTSSSYGLAVDVTPMDGVEGYRCKATVRNLDADTVLAAPALALPEGEEASTSTTMDTGDLIKFQVSHSAGKISYHLEMRSAGGLLIAEHRATVSL